MAQSKLIHNYNHLNQAQENCVIIISQNKQVWEQRLQHASWRYCHCEDLRQVKTILEQQLAVILVDLTEYHFSFSGLYALAEFSPFSRWIVYGDQNALNSHHATQFMGRFCSEYIESSAQSSIINRISHQIKILPWVKAARPENIFSNSKAQGSSLSLTRLKKQIHRIAQSHSCVLIEGERGVGRTMAARQIHQTSARHQNPCITLHSEDLMAIHDASDLNFKRLKKIFHLELMKAEGGSLIIQRVDLLPNPLQAYFLTCLSEDYSSEYLETKLPNVRLIVTMTPAGFNKHTLGGLDENIRLKYNPIHLYIPSLRERLDDLEDLTDYFVDVYANQFQIDRPVVLPETIDKLKAYVWPGNITELSNRIKKAVLFAESNQLTPQDFDFPSYSLFNGGLQHIKSSCEKEAILNALSQQQYNVTQAAIELKVSRATLYRLMGKHQINDSI